MRSKIIASIITYNPDPERLANNLAAIAPQVDEILVVDNGSEHPEDVLSCVSHFDNIHTKMNEKNLGIATALNQAFRMAGQNTTAWVLTLDQDSICPPDMVKNFRKELSKIYHEYGMDAVKKIGIICPTIVDRNTGLLEGGKKEVHNIKRCITSGSLTSFPAWKRIGGFDDKMFIDGVDFEFCDRLRKNGYSILRVGYLELCHELGNMTSHKFLWKTVRVQNHSATRKYYIVRNRFYVAKKKHNIFDIVRAFLFYLKFSATVALFEEDKKEKLKSMRKAIKDGIKL